MESGTGSDISNNGWGLGEQEVASLIMGNCTGVWVEQEVKQ